MAFILFISIFPFLYLLSPEMMPLTYYRHSLSSFSYSFAFMLCLPGIVNSIPSPMATSTWSFSFLSLYRTVSSRSVPSSSSLSTRSEDTHRPQRAAFKPTCVASHRTERNRRCPPHPSIEKPDQTDLVYCFIRFQILLMVCSKSTWMQAYE